MLSKKCRVSLLLCMFALPAASYAAPSEDNFQLRTTRDLVELCSVKPPDPMNIPAINFCHGFAIGVYRVLDEQEAARRSGRLFCVPASGPSRNETIADFVSWAADKPSLMQQAPTDSIAAYLAQKFPCPRGK